MDLKQFIEKNNVDKAKNLVNDIEILEAEKLLNIKFGSQLYEYLKSYGYLAFSFVELYGMNSNQKLNSDMIKQSLYIHKYYPLTKGLVAIENQGEGDYYFVDSNDNVFEYDVNIDKLYDTKLNLFDYILNRFLSIQE